MQGGIIDKEMPIHVSNVDARVRQVTARRAIGYRFDDDGKKIRVCRKCGGDALMARRPTAERPACRQRYDTELMPAAPGPSSASRNVMQVPRLEKIVVNMGVGRGTQQQSLLDGAVDRPHDRSPARSRSSPGRRSRSPASSSARATPSAPR